MNSKFNSVGSGPNHRGFGVGTGLGISLAQNARSNTTDGGNVLITSPMVGVDSSNYDDYYSRRADFPPAPDSMNPAIFPVSPLLTSCFLDDNVHLSQIPGEKIVMDFQNVHFITSRGTESLGSFVMTFYQLYFISYGKKMQIGKLQSLPKTFHIPLHRIDNIILDQRSIRTVGSTGGIAVKVDVVTKDFTSYKFGFQSVNDCERVIKVIQNYANPPRLRDMFAFIYKKSIQQHILQILKTKEYKDDVYSSANVHNLESGVQPVVPAHLDGWKMFNPLQEYTRMNVPIDHFRITRMNTEYGVCSSYPSILVVPHESVISDQDFLKVAQFRASGRAPVLTWKNPRGDQTIWRSSQPQSGVLNSRCVEDERLVDYIGKSNSVNQQVHIYDARPMANAMGNSIVGKGYESSSCYKTSTVFFMNIDNIHKVRDSFKKLLATVNAGKTDSQLFHDIGVSGWFFHLHNIMHAVNDMVTFVDQQGGSFLTHCSDGWDRTSQLTSLVKLCVDPFYRTMRGFITLIEHEWLSFGHKFHERYAHPGFNFPPDQRSPVFHQFLDCVYQMTVQFPRHFEFTSEFLVQLAHHVTSSRFGTFLFNTERERRMGRFVNNNNDMELIPIPSTFGPPAHEPNSLHVLREETVSLWTYFFTSPASVAGHFTNSIYADGGCGDAADVNTLHVNTLGEKYTEFLSSASFKDSDIHSNNVIEYPLARGSVLYPSFDYKCFSLWTECYTRMNVADFLPSIPQENYGNMFPGGATTSVSSSNNTKIYNQHHHESKTIARCLVEELAQEKNKLKKMQLEMKEMQDKITQLMNKSSGETITTTNIEEQKETNNEQVSTQTSTIIPTVEVPINDNTSEDVESQENHAIQNTEETEKQMQESAPEAPCEE